MQYGSKHVLVHHNIAHVDFIEMLEKKNYRR